MSPETPVHVRNHFDFVVHAPLARVAPLFGAYGERAWEAGWDPHFLHPVPPADEAGAVFTVEHGGHRSTWITTIFEPEEGHIQHVSFIDGAMLTLVDIRLAEREAGLTAVGVTYERTALSPDVNAHVAARGAADAGAAESWRAAIETCLAGSSSGPAHPEQK
jgi:hypothetical protein